MQKEDWINSLERRHHRISEWLRWKGTSGGNFVQLLLKQGRLEQVAEDRVYLSSECLQGWRFLISLDNLYQCSVTFTVKKCFCCSERTSCVSFCAHCLWVNKPIQRKLAVQESDGRRKKIQIRLEKKGQNLRVSLSTAQKSGTKMVTPQGLLMK